MLLYAYKFTISIDSYWLFKMIIWYVIFYASNVINFILQGITFLYFSFKLRIYFVFYAFILNLSMWNSFRYFVLWKQPISNSILQTVIFNSKAYLHFM